VTGDGELEYDEFVDRILKRPSQPHIDIRHWKRQLQLALAADGDGKTLRAVFGEWDRNGTKRLSMNELKRGMLAMPVFKRLKLRETDIEAMFVQADTKKDGFITREQFVNYFSGEHEGMTLSAHLPPAVLLQQNKPWAADSKHELETAVKTAAWEGRLEYTVLTSDPMQRIRDRLFEKRVTATEAFRAFDVDRDGFVSRDDFIAGCTGSSHTVYSCLKDMKELGLSGLVCSSLFDEIDGSARGFVELPAWQRALTETPV
jgi:Ca2+-binding EF-hand superfamily protein